jgi:alkylhydroperoxidase family enzyme
VPAHIVSGRSVGIADEQIAHLGDDPVPDGVFSDSERVVVEYAQRSTRMEPIDDDLYRRLSEHFATPAIMELCLIIGSANTVNRLHATFHTDVDDSFRDMLTDSCPLPLPESP